MTDSGAGQHAEDQAARARNTEAMEDLISANADSSRVMIDLVESVRRETAARDRKVDALEKSQKQMHWVIIMACVLSVIFLGIAVVNAVNLSRTGRQLHETRELNAYVLDCVNNTGVCGRQNALVQERALDEIKKYNLIAFYCIRNNPATDDPRGAKFVECMNRLYPSGPQLPEQR